MGGRKLPKTADFSAFPGSALSLYVPLSKRTHERERVEKGPAFAPAFFAYAGVVWGAMEQKTDLSRKPGKSANFGRAPNENGEAPALNSSQPSVSSGRSGSPPLRLMSRSNAAKSAFSRRSAKNVPVFMAAPAAVGLSRQ
jgi:hypothetical protein